MNRHPIDLPLFWSAGQAAMVLDYLDKLRDLIWESYGEEIITLRTGELDNADQLEENQCRFEFPYGADQSDDE